MCVERFNSFTRFPVSTGLRLSNFNNLSRKKKKNGKFIDLRICVNYYYVSLEYITSFYCWKLSVRMEHSFMILLIDGVKKVYIMNIIIMSQFTISKTKKPFASTWKHGVNYYYRVHTILLCNFCGIKPSIL